MRVFERRAGEVLYLGDEIEVRVLDTDGQTVRIGVQAPRDVRIEAVEPQDSTRPSRDERN